MSLRLHTARRDVRVGLMRCQVDALPSLLGYEANIWRTATRARVQREEGGRNGEMGRTRHLRETCQVAQSTSRADTAITVAFHPLLLSLSPSRIGCWLAQLRSVNGNVENAHVDFAVHRTTTPPGWHRRAVER